MSQFEIKKDPKKVIIAGTGEGWQHISPSTNKTIYCLNDYIKTEKYQIKPDVLFIMDVLDEKPQVVSGFDNLGEVISRINKMKIPFIAPYKYEEIPTSEAFPIDECVEKFGLPYFTNTICYMIAYALLQGVEEIDVYGVNQASSHEYSEEKGGVEYWLGIANGLGVDVNIHGDKSQLLRFKGRYGNGILYGYLQSYEHIKETAKKFGETVVKRLSQPPRKTKRKVRKV